MTAVERNYWRELHEGQQRLQQRRAANVLFSLPAGVAEHLPGLQAYERGQEVVQAAELELTLTLLQGGLRHTWRCWAQGVLAELQALASPAQVYCGVSAHRQLREIGLAMCRLSPQVGDWRRASQPLALAQVRGLALEIVPVRLLAVEAQDIVVQRGDTERLRVSRVDAEELTSTQSRRFLLSRGGDAQVPWQPLWQPAGMRSE